jgi:hypothetical protein
MPIPTHIISPTALANARAVVVISPETRFHPAIFGCAWATMKAARGQSLHFDRLHPAYLIETAPDVATYRAEETARAESAADHIADITARAMARARIHIARRGYGPAVDGGHVA